jgi:hypothetical protein
MKKVNKRKQTFIFEPFLSEKFRKAPVPARTLLPQKRGDIRIDSWLKKVEEGSE